MADGKTGAAGRYQNRLTPNSLDPDRHWIEHINCAQYEALLMTALSHTLGGAYA